ncbi:MAG TPA: UbiH/UbiF/VisC/COQ6 family ubiquinone biosynthesis hydroxylase [Acetobacteraceae bacterium]|jgi:2-octaprenyl-6-methoxyphenol hydroxylase|nr:UbiH/UbiF/VisC/COQ6 family ubiquinone biosynthesis hydroxylase [Acetobacteraceae bacterium]
MREAWTVDVCVVGAGPVGGTLACRLAAAGIRTAVVDRAPLPPMENPAFDGRAYAIAAGPRRLLETAGLWAKLPEPTCPILDIRVSDGRVGRPASPLHLHFATRELGDDAGPFGWMVEARSLRVALNAHMPSLPTLQVFAPAEATVTRAPEGATVRLVGGPEIACRLVVAAEGRRSALREAAGIPVTRLPYGQTGIVSAIAHERPHHNIALEHFLPAGPFAQLPMGATGDTPHVSAIVWTERDARACIMLGLDDTRFAREISRRLGDHLGAVRPIGRRWHYPLAAMLAHRYIDARLVLVGDAAHGVHPIAGQGLNLGFRDAEVLAELVIAAVAAGADPGAPELLSQYQRQRRPDNLAMLVGMDALDRLFSNNNPVLRLARDVGIAAVHRIGPLKRAFMRQAMGGGT